MDNLSLEGIHWLKGDGDTAPLDLFCSALS